MVVEEAVRDAAHRGVAGVTWFPVVQQAGTDGGAQPVRSDQKVAARGPPAVQMDGDSGRADVVAVDGGAGSDVDTGRADGVEEQGMQAPT